MQRLRANFLGGQLDVTLNAADVIMSGTGVSRLPVITDGVNYMPISLNPDGEGGIDPEIAYVTSHAEGATTATIARGQENTAAQIHQAGYYWRHAPTAKDYAGRFFTGWGNASHYENDAVVHNGFLWLARRDTSTEPGENVFTPTTDVGGTAWSQNSCASVITSEVKLINSGVSDTATVASNETFINWDGATIEYDVQVSGTADHLEIGIFDGALEPTVVGSQGYTGVAGFWGMKLDIYNNLVYPMANGSSGTSFAYTPDTSGYEKWRLNFADNRDGTVTISCYRSGGSVLVVQRSVTAPTFEPFRLAVGARSGGQTGVFAVRGRPYILDNGVESDWRRITRVIDL